MAKYMYLGLKDFEGRFNDELAIEQWDDLSA